MELVASKTTEERFVHFWTISNTFLARLLNSRLLTVACLKGAAPAGGLAIAMCCDFRISTSNTTTGLNEVSIGLSVPPIWMQRLTQLVGHGNTERISQLSFMIQAKEAKQIGLFDEVVENEQDLLPKASAFLKKILAYPDAGRLITKSSLRNDLAKQWGDVGRIQQEARSNFKILQQPQNVKVLEAVLKRLSKPKL
ncbi:ClpP/crotonase-like domain-containing protein [Gorgonomyces haynaldii]|nr:ClpP/crotonase-like domain-containing protein [Gorgonomyces haynaldii]